MNSLRLSAELHLIYSPSYTKVVFVSAYWTWRDAALWVVGFTAVSTSKTRHEWYSRSGSSSKIHLCPNDICSTESRYGRD